MGLGGAVLGKAGVALQGTELAWGRRPMVSEQGRAGRRGWGRAAVG